MKAMFSPKNLLMLVAGSFLGVSCTLPEPYQASSPAQNPPVTKVDGQTPLTAEQAKKEEELREKRIKANKEAKERREKLKKEQEVNGGTVTAGGDEIKPIKRDPIKPSKSFPTARWIPGKKDKGMVYNPWTNNPVDVRGIASGTLIRDPSDSNPAHKFFVP